MKVCSLYGVGYYYIPGTDTCIKIGGYVRWEGYHNTDGTSTGGAYPNFAGQGGNFTRNVATFGMMARFRLTTDVRTQTEYGTLRSYFSAGFNIFNTPNETVTSGSSISMERAFIQFAGFTIGRADSFFAFYNGAAYGFVPMQMDGSSGPSGKNVFAYTWQFGNGLSASLSAEDAFAYAKPVVDLNVASQLIGATAFATTTSDQQGQAMPDIIGNLRVDQAWGSAQIMGAVGQIGARYYNSFPANPCGGNAGTNNATGCSYPGDKYGWAVGGGLTLNMPWDKKDTLSGVIAYSEGLIGYVGSGWSSNWLGKSGGMAVGPHTNAVFAQPNTLIPGYDGSLQLTSAWGGTVAFEHYWTPTLRTSWVFGYMDVSYNDTAKLLIAANSCAALGGAITQVAAGRNNTCNPDYSAWRLASRTMWNPVANLDVGLEVAYTKINTAFAGTGVVAGSGGFASGTYAIQDQDVWTATMRVQRNFWP